MLYRQIPPITYEFFQSELDRVNSPMASQGRELYDILAGAKLESLGLAQLWREAQYDTDRILLKWSDYNPFNMKVWEQDPRPPASIGRIGSKPTGVGGPGYAVFASYESAFREYVYRLTNPAYKGGVYQPDMTLEEFAEVFAPGYEKHPVTGTPNEGHIEIFYTLLKRWGVYREEGGQPVPVPTLPTEGTMATHRYILSPGHRNTNGGGARNEINWTYPSCLALKAAIEARGGKAWIVTQLDGDNDPTFSQGRGLQNVAGLCVALAEKYGPFDAYISSHYNGGNSPGFHAIFPDAHSGVDIKANNPLDVRLARVMRDKVRDTNTVRMISWTKDSPGVMSEKETGVGAQGYRLGEFVGTLGFRDSTARIIIEASSIDVASEARYINDPNWVRNVYCEAIVDALEEVFGEFTDRPDTQPEPPITLYATKKPISALLDLPAYHEVLDSSGKRIAQVVRADYTVKVTAATPAMEFAGGSGRVRADFQPNDLVDVEYLIINSDGTMYWYTADGIRFRFADAAPYFPDVDEGNTA